MQDRPDRVTLLQAVARFLGEDLASALQDRELAFKVRIAAYLVQMVTLELTHEEAHDAAQLERLRALFGQPDETHPASPAQVREAIAHLETRLVDRIRNGELDDEERARITEHVKATLMEKLSVVQPRFDTRRDIEA